jgi:glycyl-tRNA synthetase alpha subunit
MNTDDLLKYFDKNGLGKNHGIKYDDSGQPADLPQDESCKMTYQDLLKLLEIYHIFSKREAEVYELVYNYHGCDSYESVFRDYDKFLLVDKADGVEIGIDEMKSYIKRVEEIKLEKAKNLEKEKDLEK